MKPLKGGKHPEKSVDEMLKKMASLLNSGAPKIIPNNTGISYSGLLLQLIKPYMQHEGDLDELEFLLDLGVVGWNMAVYKQKNALLYEAYRSALMSDPQVDEEMKKLIEKLMKDKEKDFGQYDVLLEDFNITVNKNNKGAVNVISKPFEQSLNEVLSEDFVNNMFKESADKDDNNMEDEDDEDLPDYVLPVINRNAIAVKPKAPFFEWLRKVYFPDPPPGEKEEEDGIYLLQEMDSDKDVQKWIKKNFERIFCSELWSWNMDENNWPKKRTYKMFTEWFEVKTHCMVYDLEKYPVNKG